MSEQAKSVPNREFELKLLLPPRGVDKLRRSALWRGLPEREVKDLRSTYYDSADRRLLRHGFTLRVRRSGNAAEQTLKWDGDADEPLARTEWNWPLEGGEAAIAALAEVDPLARVADFDPASLQPLCEVAYQRATRLWQHHGTTLELALDTGEISAGSGSEALSELEIELKAGDPAEVFALARSINEVLPVSPSTESKGARGLSLSPAGQAPWHKPRPLAVHPAMTLDDGLAGVIAACLEHLSRNLECARQGSHHEGVHQVRVAIRRLRTTLRLFAKVLPDDAAAFDVRLRDLARELGPVRDLDVFRLSLQGEGKAASASARALEQLDRMAAKLQATAQARANQALTAPEFGRLMIDLHEWQALRRWRAQPTTEKSALLFHSAREAVGQRLDRLHRKLVKGGQGFARLSQQERHELRIAVKRLRYGLDLFGALYAGRKVRAYRQRLVALQEQLGDNNDVVAAEGIVRQILLARRSLEFTLNAGAILGWLRCAAAGREGSIAEEWAAFMASARPWR